MENGETTSQVRELRTLFFNDFIFNTLLKGCMIVLRGLDAFKELVKLSRLLRMAIPRVIPQNKNYKLIIWQASMLYIKTHCIFHYLFNMQWSKLQV